VSRKLVKEQTQLGQIAQALGAEFLWTYDDTCTHFIYAGKLTDTNKELKVAKEGRKVIVSANWLYECKEKAAAVDEALFLVGGSSAMKGRASVAGRGSETPVVKAASAGQKEKVVEALEESVDHEMNEVTNNEVGLD